MPKVLRSTDDEVPKCEKCKWQFVAVYIKGQCVMISKCKVCGEFGQTYTLVPEPFFGSAVIQPEKLPSDFKEYLETVIGAIKDYPVCYV
ncbi:MAG: hypothetical protein AAB527_01770 [Patescibacteria group bacterium]